VKFCDTPHIIDPIVNSVRAKRRADRRPKTCEKVTEVVCQTFDARRKEVPAHRAWIDAPWSAAEMV